MPITEEAALSKEEIDQILSENLDHDCDGFGPQKVCVRIVAIADLPTEFGDFYVVAFQNNRDNKEHAALIKGEVFGGSSIPVRLHSECVTGDTFGSRRCDCRTQLHHALRRVEEMATGVVLYLRQEGRGIGFTNKIRAYALQDGGLNTYEANRALGFNEDEREYSVAAHMLYSMNIASIRLMTNNPKKITDLEQHGVVVEDRIPHSFPATDENSDYLEAKRAYGHLLGR